MKLKNYYIKLLNKILHTLSVTELCALYNALEDLFMEEKSHELQRKNNIFVRKGRQ